MADPAPETTLAVGQVWLPAQAWSNAAPRQIKPFTDVTGAPWIAWNYPGYPSRGGTMSVRSFRAWVRRHGATVEERTDA